MSPRPEPAPRGSRTDEGNVLRQALVGIGWVALVSALLTVVGALLAVLVSLGY